MTINSSTGTITWTPTAGINSVSESVVISVSDGTTATTQSFTIISTGLNSAPVITQGATTSVIMNEDSFPTPFSLTLNATDAESNTITWSISTDATHGTASLSSTPTGASQVISFTPTANYNGTDSFVVTASYGSLSDMITINVTITAVNDAPLLTVDTSDRSLKINQDFNLRLTATDVDSSILSCSVTDLPNWLSFNNSTGVISGTASIAQGGARYALSVGVSDGILGTKATINLIVEKPETTVSLNSIMIKVLNESKVPLTGARVQLIGNPQILYTNASGEVVFDVGAVRDTISVKVSSDRYLGKEEHFSLDSL